MDPAFLLLHSCLLGPATWAPVADRLRAAGAHVVVPSLLPVADAAPPFWPTVVDLVVAALPAGRPVVLVAHSNAGLLVPAVVAAAGEHVVGCAFVDASLPAREGSTPAADPGRLDALRARAVGDRLPPWTTWWDEADLARLFPDAATRERVSAEQPRLPLAYYEQRFPVPAGWDRRPCSYLSFGGPYERHAERARERGWDVTALSGNHLHQLVDPQAVADHLLAQFVDRQPVVRVAQVGQRRQVR